MTERTCERVVQQRTVLTPRRLCGALADWEQRPARCPWQTDPVALCQTHAVMAARDRTDVIVTLIDKTTEPIS